MHGAEKMHNASGGAQLFMHVPMPVVCLQIYDFGHRGFHQADNKCWGEEDFRKCPYLVSVKQARVCRQIQSP